MNILFIGAHPDDIELGCAGAICNLLDKGNEIFCYHLTNGAYTDLDGKNVRDYEEIYSTTKNSLGILGVKEENIIFTDIPATELKVNKNTITNLQKYIIDNEIKTIFTHPDPDTYHQDHRAAHNISMASARRYVHNIFLFEIIFNFASGLMIPNLYINISDYIQKKQDSLRFHKTEYLKFGEENWIESVTSLAKFRGTQAGVNYAEAFYVMKTLYE